MMTREAGEMGGKMRGSKRQGGGETPAPAPCLQASVCRVGGSWAQTMRVGRDRKSVV